MQEAIDTLEYVGIHPGCRSSAFATALGLVPNTATARLRRYWTRGLLARRRADPGGTGRGLVYRYWLTREGKKRLDDLRRRAAWVEAYAQDDALDHGFMPAPPDDLTLENRYWWRRGWEAGYEAPGDGDDFDDGDQ